MPKWLALRVPVWSPRQRLWLELLGIGLIVMVVVGVTLAYIWPWLPPPTPAGSSLDRYLPVRDGEAWLVAYHEPDGTLSSWQSLNTIVEPSARLFTLRSRIRQSARDVLAQFYEVSLARQSHQEIVARLAQVQVTETRERELSANGSVSGSTAIYARDPRGHFLIGFYNDGDGSEEIYDPPMLSMPEGLWVGRTWESSGNLSTGETYLVRGEVLKRERFRPFRESCGTASVPKSATFTPATARLPGSGCHETGSVQTWARWSGSSSMPTGS